MLSENHVHTLVCTLPLPSPSRYIGKLKNGGKVFDQTKGNATFSFRLGVGEVIKGERS